MGQQLMGGALTLIGVAPLGFVAIGRIGGYTAGIDTLSLMYGVLIVLLGGGVYADEIQFEGDSAGTYEGLILLYAILVIIMMVGSLFISLS